MGRDYLMAPDGFAIKMREMKIESLNMPGIFIFSHGCVINHKESNRARPYLPLKSFYDILLSVSVDQGIIPRRLSKESCSIGNGPWDRRSTMDI